MTQATARTDANPERGMVWAVGRETEGGVKTRFKTRHARAGGWRGGGGATPCMTRVRVWPRCMGGWSLLAGGEYGGVGGAKAQGARHVDEEGVPSRGAPPGARCVEAGTYLVCAGVCVGREFFWPPASARERVVCASCFFFVRARDLSLWVARVCARREPSPSACSPALSLPATRHPRLGHQPPRVQAKRVCVCVCCLQSLSAPGAFSAFWGLHESLCRPLSLPATPRASNTSPPRGVGRREAEGGALCRLFVHE